MQSISSRCVAPKAGSKHGVTNVRTVVARPKMICWQSHAAAGAASSKHVAVSRSRSIRCNASMDPATFTNMTYAGFGLAGLSFVGTFFVAPQFKDSFKEDLDWRQIYQALAATGVKQVNAAEAYAKSKSGQAILLDVRLGNKYEASHAAASLSAPLYLPIQNWDLASIIRRAGFAFFGIYGTELNTNFAAEVRERVPQGKQIIVLCETGGSIENKSGTKFGFQSRSLKALFYLQQAGLDQVAFVKGGLPAFAREGYPMASGPEDLSAVPALQPEPNEEVDSSGKGGFSFKLPGGFKLPQLSLGFARR